MAELRPRRRNREGEERGSKQKLTGRSMGWSACSGKSRRRRTGADDLGRPTTKMTAMAAPWALRLAWIGEEVAGDEAELLGTTGRRGGGGGYGHGVRR